jgi:hypothetical protein
VGLQRPRCRQVQQVHRHAARGLGRDSPHRDLSTCYRGYYETPQTAPVHGLSAIAREDAITAAAPIEDYNAQPFSFSTPCWPDKPTTRTQLETRTQTALESGSYPLLSSWYAHRLDPENYPDPTTTTQEDHRCDLGRPAYKNPGGNTEPPPLTAKDPIPYQPTGRPSQALGAPDPYLRWGTTIWGGGYLDNWRDWDGDTFVPSTAGVRDWVWPPMKARPAVCSPHLSARPRKMITPR